MASIVDPDSDDNPIDDEYFVRVSIPRKASPQDVDRIFCAVAEAAETAQPEDRDWDVFIHGSGPRPDDI